MTVTDASNGKNRTKSTIMILWHVLCTWKNIVFAIRLSHKVLISFKEVTRLLEAKLPLKISQKLLEDMRPYLKIL